MTIDNRFSKSKKMKEPDLNFYFFFVDSSLFLVNYSGVIIVRRMRGVTSCWVSGLLLGGR